MAVADANPLVAKVFPIPFDAIAADHIEPAVDTLLADAHRRLERLCSTQAPQDFETVMLGLEDLTAELEHAMGIVGHLEGVATNPALRQAYNAARPRVAEFLSGLPRHEPLWTTVKRYAQSAEAQQLSGARRRFLEKTLSAFRRDGADLDKAGKQRLAEIDVALTQACLRYGQNVLDATNAFELVLEEEHQLAGLPAQARRAARQSAREVGQSGWRLTLQGPSYQAGITYLDDPQLREQLYRAMTTRATREPHDNRELVSTLLSLRAEKAKLLGYASFVDLVTEDRMAKSGARAQAFILDMTERTRHHFEAEKQALLDYRRELEGPDASPLEPWDVPYYAEKQRLALYHYDREALRPYFAFEGVLAGAFTIVQRLYGLCFEPWNDAPSWHEQVRAYKVIDQASGDWLAGIYVDPYPRPTKQGGAWMHGVMTRGRIEADGRQIGVLVANVSPPVDGQEALLAHDDVETLFHELGHLMHHCLSRAELRSMAGTQVAWDFVELPSQLLENWCWEPAALDLFAHHVDTGEPLADELHQAMTRARTFRAASQQMVHLGLATADLVSTWTGTPIGMAIR
jgi:oligopeptidase A